MFRKKRMAGLQLREDVQEQQKTTALLMPFKNTYTLFHSIHTKRKSNTICWMLMENKLKDFK